MPMWGNLYFIDPCSSLSEMIGDFYEGAICMVVFIVTLVVYWIWYALTMKFSTKTVLEAKWLEFAWTITPFFILFAMALPSLHCLYVIDDSRGDVVLLLNAIGHQWYWSYEFSGQDHSVIGFDSFMEQESDRGFRLLEVDHRMVAPIGVNVRWSITSADVLHSFAMPSLILNADAIPGRINDINITVTRSGVLYGQCSEICGANHSFMPIVIEFVPMSVWNRWWNIMCDSSCKIIEGFGEHAEQYNIHETRANEVLSSYNDYLNAVSSNDVVGAYRAISVAEESFENDHWLWSYVTQEMVSAGGCFWPNEVYSYNQVKWQDIYQDRLWGYIFMDF